MLMLSRTGLLLLCLFLLSSPLPGGALAAQAAEKIYSNSLGMEFILIPAGSFTMGTEQSSPYGYGDERPQHRVTIQSFYLGSYEVTQAQWTAVMRNNPSEFARQNNPVERISWHDAQMFIKRLNQKEGRRRYRLPTEAEWEYAARAGTNSAYSFGDDPDSLGRYGWYSGNSDDTTHPAGQKEPNPWGLYDMYGNVEEWVQDRGDKTYYPASPGSDSEPKSGWLQRPGDNAGTYYARSPLSDPQGPSSGPNRVLRGGSWNLGPQWCRSASRNKSGPAFCYSTAGFRLALSLELACKK
jgi:formylglycine-generating enzyme required for sulfatase activity